MYHRDCGWARNGWKEEAEGQPKATTALPFLRSGKVQDLPSRLTESTATVRAHSASGWGLECCKRGSDAGHLTPAIEPVGHKEHNQTGQDEGRKGQCRRVHADSLAHNFPARGSRVPGPRPSFARPVSSSLTVLSGRPSDGCEIGEAARSPGPLKTDSPRG